MPKPEFGGSEAEDPSRVGKSGLPRPNGRPEYRVSPTIGVLFGRQDLPRSLNLNFRFMTMALSRARYSRVIAVFWRVLSACA